MPFAMCSFKPIILLAFITGIVHAWKPNECPQDCVRPLSFWTENRPDAGAFWPDHSDSKTFPCGSTWLEVIVATTDDSWTLLAKQYIAAKLNILSFSCIEAEALPTSITQALQDACVLLSNEHCTVSDEALAIGVTAIVKQFNSGTGAVATCLCPSCPGNGGSNPSTPHCPTCPTCPTYPTPSPFTCTPSVVDQCCEHPTSTLPPASCGPCTRTQGYFKTHSELWNSFTLCGISALSILETASSGGDAFIILARQYIAARLNVKALDVCLEDSIVSGALVGAETLLRAACISSSGYATPEKGSDIRDEFIAMAAILDSFNNGLLGPGHCDDDSDTTTAHVTQLYLNALEGSSTLDNALFSSAGIVVPAVLCVFVALSAIIM